MKNAKFIRLFYALIFLITYISPVLAQVTLAPLEGLPGAYEPGEGIEGAGTSLSKIFTNTFGVMTIVAGLMFMFYFVLGGLSWITAGGKAEQVEKAKSQMTNAVIGLIVVVAAYGITFIIGQVLGIPILEPEKFLYKIFPGFGEGVTGRRGGTGN